MALHDNKSGDNVNEKAADVDPGPTPREENEAPRTERRGQGFYNRNTNQEKKVTPSYNFRNDGPLLSASAGEGDVANFVKLANETLEEKKSILSVNGKLEWIVIPATGKETEMKLDGAVVAARMTDTGDVFASTIIFVGNQPMPKQPVQMGRDRTVRFTTTANDQYTADGYQESLERLLARSNSNFGQNITHVAMTPIFREKLSDAEQAKIITGVINQVAYQIQSMTETNEFSIAALDMKNNDLIANVAFQQGDAFDPINELPMRADIRVDLSVTPREERRGGIVNVLSERLSQNLVGVTAFVDLFYKGEKEQSRSFFRDRKNEDTDTRIYGTNLVITDLKPVAPLPEYLIFALGQIPALVREQVVVQGLRPVGGKGSLRDANALTYELKGEFEKLPEALSDEQWEDVVRSVIREGSQIVTVHVPRSGINSPWLRLLVDACDRRNPNWKEAADILIAAADNVTGERFSTSLPESALYDIGYLNDMPALLGDWVDEQHQKRDLREIGYFEVLTAFGQKEPMVVEDFSLLTDERIDLQERMDMNEQIVDQFTGGQFHITERADVVEINPDWIFALTDAMTAAGMVVTADGINQDTRALRRGRESRYETDGYSGGGFRTRGRGGYGFGRR